MQVNLVQPYAAGKVVAALKKRYVDFDPPIAIERAEVIFHSKSAENREGIEEVVCIQLKRTDPQAMEAAMDRLRAHPDVVYAEPDYLEQAHIVPNDPLFRNLWGMRAIRAPQAWNVSRGSARVVVGVLDSGVDRTHPDLRANIVPGGRPFDFMDESGHGTHVAGTVGAAGNNRIGVAGVCWSVGLVSYKLGDRVFDLAAAVAAIDDARINRIPILNNSWGGRGFSAVLRFAISQYDGLFVASAGNNGTNNDAIPMFPASYDSDNVLSVAASMPNGSLAPFSNFGARSVDIAAPGNRILSARPRGGYSYLSGTSMAAPHVAGAAALLKAVRPGLSARDIKRVILASARRNASLAGRVATGGVLDAEAMLALALR